MKIIFGLLFSISVVLTGCGGEGGSGGGTKPATVLAGTFVNSPTKGIKYAAMPSGVAGTTDENGTFKYQDGDSVTFSVDLGVTTLVLGTLSKPTASNSVLSLTVPGGGDPLAIAQVLETLDRSASAGKMDVSGISLPQGPTLTKITEALRSPQVSQADIAVIASGVQATLNSSNGGVLRYGSLGVGSNQALANLSVNLVNQSLVETKIRLMSNDGRSTILNWQDKPAFTNWLVKRGSSFTAFSRFGLIKSDLTYSFRGPSTDTNLSGTYSLANSNIDGRWRDIGGTATGVFSIISSDTNSFTVKYDCLSCQETGAITGTYLQPVLTSDLLNKSIVLSNWCESVRDSTLTIRNNGGVTDDCQSNYSGGAIQGLLFPTQSPIYANTIQYLAPNGVVHLLGITSVKKGAGSGNLPSGSTGTIVDISSYNKGAPARIVSFKVN